MMNSLIIKRGLKNVDTFKSLSKRLVPSKEILPKKKKNKNVAVISSSVKLVPNDTNFKIVVDEPITFAKEFEKSSILSNVLEEEEISEKQADAFLGYAIEKSDQVCELR